MVACSAILEPNTWWDRMTYSFWNQTWHESVIEILVSMVMQGEEGSAKGKAFTYNRKSLLLPSVQGIESEIVDEWKKELDAVAVC